jgi:hypothetical protein
MRRVPYNMKKLFVTAFAGVLLLSGCSSSSDNAATPASGERAQLNAGDAAAKQDAPAAAPEGVTATAGPVEGRSLVYRGNVTVRVDKVEEMADRVAAIASTAGGFVSAEKRTSGGPNAQASITVRVPSKQFHQALEQIAGLGKEIDRGTNTEDVTEAVVDLDTRIAAARASVNSVRAMFAQAKELSQVVLLEKELSQREATLASLEAKKRQLDDLVALSTITVSLVGPQVEIVVPKSEPPGFLGGLSAGWSAFVLAVQVALAVLGFLLPFALALGVPAILLVWWVRRRRAGASKQPADAP